MTQSVKNYRLTPTTINVIDPLGLFGDGRSYRPKPNPNAPLGHSDFTGYDKFDYTAEDHDRRTSPTNPFLGNPGAHFQDLKTSLAECRAYIETCDPGGGARAMHRMQDYYSHYVKDYRWEPGKGNLGHLFAGTGPDNDQDAWKQAEAKTKELLAEWNANNVQYINSFTDMPQLRKYFK